MADHYTYLGHFIENPDIQKYVTALALGGVMLLVTKKAGSIIRVKGKDSLVVPEKKLGMFSLIDWMMDRFIQYQDSVLGKSGRQHFPFIATIFFFLLFSNLLGVFPGMAPITNSIWVNVGIALAVFFYFNIWGIKEYGFFSYIKHFAGPVNGWYSIVVGPLIFFAEVLSTFLRPFTLNVRLYWNIKGDHMVLGIIHDLMGYFSIVFASPLFGLAVFVSFMQAFVFATLTMVYVLLASNHDDHGDH